MYVMNSDLTTALSHSSPCHRKLYKTSACQQAWHGALHWSTSLPMSIPLKVMAPPLPVAVYSSRHLGRIRASWLPLLLMTEFWQAQLQLQLQCLPDYTGHAMSRRQSFTGVLHILWPYTLSLSFPMIYPEPQRSWYQCAVYGWSLSIFTPAQHLE